MWRASGSRRCMHNTIRVAERVALPGAGLVIASFIALLLFSLSMKTVYGLFSRGCTHRCKWPFDLQKDIAPVVSVMYLLVPPVWTSVSKVG